MEYDSVPNYPPEPRRYPFETKSLGETATRIITEVKSVALTDGVERHRIEGVEVPITDPARSIVDCFRYRAKVGLDVAMEGLREGLRRQRCTPDELWRLARQARVWSVMRPYVEAMVADGA